MRGRGLGWVLAAHALHVVLWAGFFAFAELRYARGGPELLVTGAAAWVTAASVGMVVCSLVGQHLAVSAWLERRGGAIGAVVVFVMGVPTVFVGVAELVVGGVFFGVW